MYTAFRKHIESHVIGIDLRKIRYKGRTGLVSNRKQEMMVLTQYN